MKRINKLFFSALLVGGLMFASCQDKNKDSKPDSEEPVYTWADPSYTWASDYSSCYAERICHQDASKNEVETAASTYNLVNEPSCLVAGYGTYTAEFENPIFETQQIQVDLDALGHSYGAPTYEWSTDHKTCTAKRVCIRNAEHIESETVDANVEVLSPATYEAGGESRFTATFVNEAFETQVFTTNTNVLDDLIFTLKNGGTEYSVKMNQESVVDEISIPATYNSLPVTAIDNYGFSGNACNVKKITIPTSITSIPFYTFYANPYIVEIVGLSYLANQMFDNCISLRKITFADSYTTLSGNEFKGCRAEELIFPGIETVAGYSFEDNEYVKHITFGKNLNSVGSYAFLNTSSLVSVTVDSECTKFFSDNGVLYNNDGSNQILVVFPARCPIQNYTFVSGTTKISSQAFQHTVFIQEVTLNSEFAAFSGEDFYGSKSLRRVVITNPNITMTCERTFSECPNLEEVVYPNGANYVCENGLIMNNSKSTIYFILGGYTGVVSIPASVGIIKYTYAYRSVKCSAIEVDPTSNYFSSENGLLLNKDKTELLRYPYKPNETVITKDSIPSTVTTAGQYSFSGFTHVTEIDLSESNISVYSVGVFGINSALVRVKYSTGTTDIASFQVRGSSNVTELVFPMSKQDFISIVNKSNQWLSKGPAEINAVFTDETVEAHTL